MKTLSKLRLVSLGRVSALTRAIRPGVSEEFGNPDYFWPF